MLNIEFDITDLMRGLHVLESRLPAVKAQIALTMAKEAFRISGEQVPHDIGTLQASGKVEPEPDGAAIMGYHTVYAARLHEHPEYNFQKGRKAKFVEDPAKEVAGRAERIVTSVVQQQLGIR